MSSPCPPGAVPAGTAWRCLLPLCLPWQLSSGALLWATERSGQWPLPSLPGSLVTVQPALRCRPEFLERKLAELEMNTMLIIMDDLWIEFLQVGRLQKVAQLSMLLVGPPVCAVQCRWHLAQIVCRGHSCKCVMS